MSTKKKSKSQKVVLEAPRGGVKSRVTATALPGVLADGVTLEGMAEYRRKDESELIMPEANIVTELTSAGVMNVRRAYILMWLVPDPANNRGALLAVERFSVKIINEGIYDVNIVMQQPHGHEGCPSSLAAWVLLSNTTIKSGATIAHTITPVDNNLVVPYRVDLQGTDCIAFATFSAARQSMSPGGTTVDRAEVGLRIVVEAHYKASGNALQSGRFFALRAMSDDAIMSTVDSKPPVPLAIHDVAPGVTKMTWSAVKPHPIFWRGSDYLPDDQLPGLDETQVYRLPYPVIGKSSVGLYIRYLTDKWYVVPTPDSTTAVEIGPYQNNALGDVSADALLIPLPKFVFTRRLPLSRSGPLLASKLVRPKACGGVRQLYGKSTWKDDFLSSVSFIVSVIKIAAAVAGAAGLLNVVHDDEPGYVSC